MHPAKLRGAGVPPARGSAKTLYGWVPLCPGAVPSRPWATAFVAAGVVAGGPCGAAADRPGLEVWLELPREGAEPVEGAAVRACLLFGDGVETEADLPWLVAGEALSEAGGVAAGGASTVVGELAWGGGVTVVGVPDDARPATFPFETSGSARPIPLRRWPALFADAA